MNSSPRFALLGALLAATIVAGCGGGDDDKRLSKAEFAKQGNEICTRYQKQSDEIADPASLADVPAFVSKAIPLFEKQIEEMTALRPPEELQEDFDAFLATGEEAKQALLDIEEAAKANDEAQVTKISEAAAGREKSSDALATRIGLTDCAKA